MVVLKADQWRRLGRELFMAAGATESNAARVTEAVVDSSLVGHDSHGVIRFVQYMRSIEDGQLDPAAVPEVIKETATTCLVDGKWTFGHVSAELCMRKAIEKAKTQGIAMAGLRRAYHIGRLGEYAEMAHSAGTVGMILVGGLGGAGGAAGSGVAPYGGSKAAFGTNPISIGVPAARQHPVMADFATSAVAGGKISLSRAKGVPLPPNSILDKNGRPSTDPEDFYAGGVLLPFGGHKGYGLAVAIQLLGQSLTGADAVADEKGSSYRKSGSLFVAIDAGVFRPVDEFQAAADETLGKVKAIPPAEGFDEVLIPGEPESRTRERRKVEGVSMPDGSWADLTKIAAKYGIDLSSYRS